MTAYTTNCSLEDYRASMSHLGTSSSNTTGTAIAGQEQMKIELEDNEKVDDVQACVNIYGKHLALRGQFLSCPTAWKESAT